MAITQARIESLLNAAESIRQSFEYNSIKTIEILARARSQLRNADYKTSHAILITLLADLEQIHIDYKQQIAEPVIPIAVEREHWRLTHRRNAWHRQWQADKRAGIPTRGRNQFISDYQQQHKQSWNEDRLKQPIPKQYRAPTKEEIQQALAELDQSTDQPTESFTTCPHCGQPMLPDPSDNQLYCSNPDCQPTDDGFAIPQPTESNQQD